MRIKKNTILFSGVSSIGCFLLVTALHFRMYHMLNIYNNGNAGLADLREYLLVILSGLFTSSFVVFLISIREYLDEKTLLLRRLSQLCSYVSEKYRRIAFFTPMMPHEVMVDYLMVKRNYELEYSAVSEAMFASIGKTDPFRKDYEEAKKKLCGFIWEKEEEALRIVHANDKEKYLDKRCMEIEEKYLHDVRKLIASLNVFDEFNVYEYQEIIDKLSFLHYKGNKNVLRLCLEIPLIQSIKFIKFYLLMLSQEADTFSVSLYATMAIEKQLLAEDYSYILPLFQIASGKAVIDKILHPRDEMKNPRREDYHIGCIPMDFGEEALFDDFE